MLEAPTLGDMTEREKKKKGDRRREKELGGKRGARTMFLKKNGQGPVEGEREDSEMLELIN